MVVCLVIYGLFIVVGSLGVIVYLGLLLVLMIARLLL